MKKILIPLLVLYVIGLIVTFTTLWTSNKQKEEAAEAKANVEAQCDSAIILAMRSGLLLYTAEAKSHKTMNYSSSNKLSFSFLGIDKDVNLPFSKTEATIPVTVTYKAGIDLQHADSDNINVVKYPDNGRGGTIVITLPDPFLVQTSVAVDHENEKMKKEFLAKGLTYEQYQSLVRQAKQEAWDDLSQDDVHAIIETAKVSASDLMLPQLRRLGFDNIEITFRQDLDITDVEKRKN